jgi:hypothetical protein
MLTSENSVPNENKPDDIQLKLYDMLAEQLHRYVTIFWQFPLALLTANFFALDKFLSRPKILLAVSAVDCVLVYAFHRLLINQRCILAAAKRAEETLSGTNYQAFIPKFGPSKLPAPTVTVWSLWTVAIGLAALSVFRMFCP